MTRSIGLACSALWHQRADAQKVLDTLQEISTDRYVAPYDVAVIYTDLGEKDEAFSWLHRAYEVRSYILPVYLNTDNGLDSLRSDLRLDELRRVSGCRLFIKRDIDAFRRKSKGS